MPGEEATGSKPVSSATNQKGFKFEELGVLGTVLTAVGASLGLLGFVAFFGAAILWVRMDEVGLPGNEAVAIVPRSVLVATGANFLVPALLLALGFTVVLYLIDALATWISEGSWFSSVSVRNLRQQLLEAQREATRVRREAEALKAVAHSAATTKVDAVAAVQMEVEPLIVEAQAENSLRQTVSDQANAGLDVVEAEKDVLRLEAKLRATEPQRQETTETIQAVILVIGTLLLFGVGTTYMAFHYSLQLSPKSTAALVVIAASLIAFCIVVRLRSRSFGWFAVAAFLAVGLMTAALTYYRTIGNPKVEPAALLRTKGPPIYGFYVAQTSDRVYVGTKLRKGAIRLSSVPRNEIVGLVVGNLQRPTMAEEHAIAFAHRLCLQVRKRKATGRVAGKQGGGKTGEELARGCTAADLRRLRRKLVMDQAADGSATAAASRSASARSVRSQVKSSSARPKWP